VTPRALALVLVSTVLVVIGYCALIGILGR
jgi:hypothetical protein